MERPIRVFVIADTQADLRSLGGVFKHAGFVVTGSLTTDSPSEVGNGPADVVVVRSRGGEAGPLLPSRSATPVLWVGQPSGRGIAGRIFGHVEANAGPDRIRAATVALAAGLHVEPGDDRLLADESEFTLLDPLTDRELEVLNLVAEGLSNREIARRLGVSPNTIKFHVSSIIGKLGAGSRTEAVTLGLRRGLIII